METGTAGQEDFTQSAFLDRSETLGAGLREFSTASRMEWMQISKPLAELNRKRFRGWKSPPFFSPANAKQAIFAFPGDVYEGLDAGTLGKRI